MANTTWSPSDKSTGITLSGGNLTATNADNNVDGGRAAHSQTAGKFYFECTCTTFTYSLDGVGIAKATYPLGSLANSAGGGLGNFTLNQLGTTVVDGGSAGISFGTITNGTIICVAVDLTAKLGWFRKGAAGLWNNSGTANPATGTGGVSIPNLGGSVPAFPAVSVGNTNDAVTANFGDSAFAGAVPSGFTAGWPTVAPPTNTTWSTTDKSAGATLSGSNLVVSFTSGNPGVRSIDRVYTGKYYWENTFTTTLNTEIGICTGTASLTGLGSTGSANFALILTNAGNVWNNGVLAGVNVGGTVTNGWIGCVALDATNGRVWFRNGAAGNWNGSASANPATGAGGLDISGWASPGFTGLYACANGGSGSGVITANFGASAFTGAVPAGFTSGFPDSTTLLNTAATTQILVEEWGAPNPAAQLTQLLVEEWAVVIPPPFTSWSPGDKSANITLTGSNLIATNNTVGLNTALVRAADKQVSGKFYWEYTYVVAGTSTTGAGIALGYFATNGNMNALIGLKGAASVAATGLVYVDDSNTVTIAGAGTTVSLGAISAGGIVCVALDAGAQLIWFRSGAAGNWNANAARNPATGVGGISIPNMGVGFQVYPAANVNQQNDQIAANFGDTAFAGVVPSGFTAGFPAGAVLPVNEVVTQVGAEQWASIIPPNMQVTQAAIEQWTSTANLTTRMLMTQEAIEQWSTVAEASAFATRQAAVTVVT